MIDSQQIKIDTMNLISADNINAYKTLHASHFVGLLNATINKFDFVKIGNIHMIVDNVQLSMYNSDIVFYCHAIYVVNESKCLIANKSKQRKAVFNADEIFSKNVQMLSVNEAAAMYDIIATTFAKTWNPFDNCFDDAADDYSNDANDA